MATGHILPGYGDTISRLRRVQTAGYPLDSDQLVQMESSYKLGESEFDRIRSQARYLWSRRDIAPTTYRFHHSGQDLPSEEKTVSRPTSPTRKNKPHPPHVFLTNRLHYIEGMQNPDTTLGKPCYRIDASLPPEHQHERRQYRRKYVADKPRTALVNTFKDQYGLKHQLNPTDAQAAEAWLKIADDKDKGEFMMALQKNREQEDRRDEEFGPPAIPRARTAYPSLRRYMRGAGAAESVELSQVLKPPNSIVGYSGQRRWEDIDAVRKTRILPNSGRGDFLLHPDWPPTIPHHYVP